MVNISKKNIFIIALVFSLLFNFYMVYEIKIIGVEKNLNPESNPYINKFDLIDPQIAEMEVRDFLQIKSQYIASYTPLRNNLDKILLEKEGHYGVYFEDLNSHSWIGINEREKFKPASLLKVTTVSSILKMVEEREISLDKEVTLTKDDLNNRFGSLYEKEGSKFTIKELIEAALRKSDNTAIKKLHEFISDERWTEARLSMGLPLVSVQESENGTSLTPKEFSRVFHSLYYSGYLSRDSSNWVLSLLSTTDFKKGIPEGVPQEIAVAHKIGIWASDGSVHDCGIVYAKRPYILCIMSENVTEEEGEETIREISKEIYKYVSEN